MPVFPNPIFTLSINARFLSVFLLIAIFFLPLGISLIGKISSESKSFILENASDENEERSEGQNKDAIEEDYKVENFSQSENRLIQNVNVSLTFNSLGNYYGGYYLEVITPPPEI